MSEDNPHSSRGSASRSWLERIANIFNAEPQDLSDLEDIISEAAMRELIDTDTKDMLQGVLDVSKMRARDIMIPRSQMATIDIEQPLSEVLPILLENNHSRYPVVNEDKDHIEGILIVKDILQYALDDKNNDWQWSNLVRPAVIIPESKKVDALLREFRQKRYHMAIVVDEYGGVSGLVTIEDILEQIVGEIEDEHDDHEDHDIKKMASRVFQVSALTPLDEFNESFGTSFDEEDADTIGGIVLHAFGHMPARGESITLGDLKFKVSKANSRRLMQLQVIQPRKSEEEGN
ncbi:CBS domain-containing protein [Alishewanella sp. 16-MA]|uniref:Magnesium and cobalt efflux protein CorC n=1 Tax=Alishewanella maricola TaxID=2795740 RepID=A0ABS8C5G7_9ALTE|nr:MULTISPECIES: CBS domain-containing protein [Alishewanella]MDP4944334.1 CBS domain-containing protein [Alishewanella sp.]MCB5227195.1 CBS domain-containing protein [Alishewanella maricola]MDP5037229.1 CBS domain-containing protein [Alishewanella sp.]MDP5187883.1 CBS domain-containing protein [Alishewanella sp.]MDP5459321.1 transporter associated domain-containing protein [Alishewanella sp. SMS8]